VAGLPLLGSRPLVLPEVVLALASAPLLDRDIVSGAAAAVAAGSMFTFYGPHRAVLITYPTEQELDAVLPQIND